MSVLTLPQAKAYLNITVATYDTEIQDFIDAAEGWVVRKCGPLVSTTTTVKLNHPGGVMSLPTTPAISLTSITDSAGNVASLTGVSVTTEGVIFGATFARDLWTVVYQAGRATTPPELLDVVKERLRQRWVTQRGTTARPGSPTTDAPGLNLDQMMADFVQAP